MREKILHASFALLLAFALGCGGTTPVVGGENGPGADGAGVDIPSEAFDRTLAFLAFRTEASGNVPTDVEVEGEGTTKYVQLEVEPGSRTLTLTRTLNVPVGEYVATIGFYAAWDAGLEPQVMQSRLEGGTSVQEATDALLPCGYAPDTPAGHLDGVADAFSNGCEALVGAGACQPACLDSDEERNHQDDQRLLLVRITGEVDLTGGSPLDFSAIPRSALEDAFDNDGDGLRNVDEVDEVETGSHPCRADSDGDGLADGLERTDAELGEEGRDLDDTRVLDRDSDGDGYLDGQESRSGVWRSTCQTGTDPHNPDSDGDGLPDGAEGIFDPPLGEGCPGIDVPAACGARPAKCGSDPNAVDSDGDDVDDASEIAAGTNPMDKDTDGDGIEDGIEPTEGASPLLCDTDGDGLDDREEIVVHQSAPDNSDTDTLR